MTEIKELTLFIQKAILRFPDDRPIAPESISKIVIHQLDPDENSPVLVRYGCVLELRQIARAELRKTFEPEDSEQDDLFDDDLPPRMPGFGENKGKYLPRELMTREDYEGNIERYQKEITKKQKRLDKLIAEYEEKKAKGLFNIAA